MAFHPYPQVIPRLFNVNGFGPPLWVNKASTCPWVDHTVSRLLLLTMVALFRLAFATDPHLKCLTLLVKVTRRLNTPERPIVNQYREGKVKRTVNNGVK